MAIVKYGGTVSELIGKLNNVVFKMGNHGPTVVGLKSNLNSSRSNIYRQQVNIISIQQAWQNLSVANRNLWEIYAQFRNRPTRKQSGQFLRGQATFILENSIRLRHVQAFGVLAPEILTTPVITPPPQPVSIITAVATVFTFTLGMSYNIPDATKFIFCYITRPLLGSQMSNWNKKRLMANLSSTGYSQVITSTYQSLFINLPTPGQYVNTETFLYDKNISTFGSGTKQRLLVA